MNNLKEVIGLKRETVRFKLDYRKARRYNRSIKSISLFDAFELMKQPSIITLITS